MKLVFIEYYGGPNVVTTTIISNAHVCSRMVSVLSQLAAREMHNFDVKCTEK